MEMCLTLTVPQRVGDMGDLSTIVSLGGFQLSPGGVARAVPRL